jgi:hypothetical protein
MMYNKLCILLLSFLLLMSACVKQQGSTDPIKSGSEGLQLLFVDNLPKEVVVGKDDQPLILTLDIRNRGTYPETLEDTTFAAFMWFSGYDPKAISLEPLSRTIIPIEGRNQANPAGGQTLVEFSAKIISQNLNVGKYTPKLLANVCYRYQTIATPDVCIEPDPLSATVSRTTPVCRAKDASLGTQGAPVAVARVEQTTLPNEIQFKITLKNVGRGDVVHPAAQCSTQGSSQLTRQNIDKVEVSSVKIGEKELSCRPLDENKIARLVEGTGYIICTLGKADISSTSAYVTPLTIRLTYDYKQSVEKQLVINKIAV